jgi:hypothetical protein
VIFIAMYFFLCLIFFLISILKARSSL